MIDRPIIKEFGRQETAVIKMVIPLHEIKNVMGPAIVELMQTIGEQGIVPTGPVFSRHFRMDPQQWDFEVGVPVTSSVSAKGRVVSSELPPGTVATTTYTGPYEGLGDAWEEFIDWLSKEGIAMQDSLWESYAVGPESTTDENSYRTHLFKPLM